MACQEAHMATVTLDPVSLPVSEEEQVRALHELLQEAGEALLIGKGGKPAMKLPDAVYDLLLKILSVMEEGKAISIVPVTQDLTTQQAAELLAVFREAAGNGTSALSPDRNSSARLFEGLVGLQTVPGPGTARCYRTHGGR